MNADELTSHKRITTGITDPFLQMEIAKFYRNLLNGERDIIFTSDSILPVLSVLENFDCIGIISTDMLKIFGHRFNLRIAPTSFTFSSYSYHVIYRTLMSKDTAFCKMRDVIIDALNNSYIT